MRTPTNRAHRFTHIDLENWRNFARVQVDLERRVFLVGPNASGKSNFLDVFRFLHDIVSVGGGFQESVRRRGGVSSLRSLFARRYSDVVVSATVSDGSDDRSWGYYLKFTQDTQRRAMIREERVTRGGKTLFSPPDKERKGEPARRWHKNLAQVKAHQHLG